MAEPAPAASDACSRCGEVVSTRTPSEGHTQRIGLSKTTVTWRLRFSRFRWRWLPENPRDRAQGFYTDLDLCGWCAGDVFLFAQGLPPRAKPAKARPTEGNELGCGHAACADARDVDPEAAMYERIDAQKEGPNDV